MTRHGLRKWQSWSERLWEVAEAGWLVRDGQDHFYRRLVVVPALHRHLRSWIGGGEFTLVDLGAGDAYTTRTLLDASGTLSHQITRVVLIDRSPRELQAARRRLRGARFKDYCSDFLVLGWEKALNLTRMQTAFCAVFLIQELPSLRPLLTGLRNLMRPDDIFLGIIVAPSYAEELRRNGKVVDVWCSDSEAFDWRWAGKYPISTPSATLFLPHFQRTLQCYRDLFRAQGLDLEETIGLRLESSASCRGLYTETAYGRRIVGRISSRLLVARRKP